jgi:hypothetical protein
LQGWLHQDLIVHPDGLTKYSRQKGSGYLPTCADEDLKGAAAHRPRGFDIERPVEEDA